MDASVLVVGVSCGALVGGAVVGVWRGVALAAARSAAVAAREAQHAAEVRAAALEGAHRGDDELRDTLQALSAEALRHNNDHFVTLTAGLVAPVQAQLSSLRDALEAVERQRADDHGALRQLTEGLQSATARLQSETQTLSRALSDSRTRGSWGELQLRRVVELSGMAAHVDFDEQRTVAGDDASGRPDVVVHLPGDRKVVIDAKAPLDAYLRAAKADDPAVVAGELAAHGKALSGHVRALAQRDYTAKVGGAVDFVVLFVPGDAFLSAAFEADATLFDDAVRRGVLLATPVTLIALLRAVEFGWRQQQAIHNADAIVAAGRELHERVTKFAEHFGHVGTNLAKAVAAYDKAVGSFGARVQPSLRRLEDLGSGSGKPLNLTVLDATPRVLAVQAAEGAGDDGEPVAAAMRGAASS